MEKEELKILAIDDEEGLRNLISYEFGRRGYTVRTASNGMEALELLKKEKFRVAISDIKMPEMDGMEALEKMKQIDPDIEIIMTTSYGTIQTAVDSMKKGAYDFIQKPFNIKEMVNLVEKAFEKAELKTLITLYEGSQTVFSSIKLDELLPLFTDLSYKLLKADDVSILIKDENQKLKIEASKGLENEGGKKLRIQISGKFMERSSQKEAQLIQFPKNEEYFTGWNEKMDIRSAILFPLCSKTENFGVICVCRSVNPIIFSLTDIRHAHILFSQLLQAVNIAKLYQDLEKEMKEVQRAYRELSLMKNELVQSEKFAAIGELASGVAHEINNPLTTINCLTELLERGEKSEQKIKDLNTIGEQVERCQRIVQSLLHFARKQTFEKKKSSLHEILEKTIVLIQHDFKINRIELIKEFHPDLPSADVDPSSIQQVFVNMMQNAKDALKNRPDSKLIIKTAFVPSPLPSPSSPPQRNPAAKKDKEAGKGEEKGEGGKIKIDFIDNGAGIPENIKNKIFDPFFTTKVAGEGTGLGLSISLGILKEHGGAIEVQSEEGKGTTFSISLPAV